MRYAVFAVLSLGCSDPEGVEEVEYGDTVEVLYGVDSLDCGRDMPAEIAIPQPSVWQVVLVTDDIREDATTGMYLRDGVLTINACDADTVEVTWFSFM